MKIQIHRRVQKNIIIIMDQLCLGVKPGDLVPIFQLKYKKMKQFIFIMENKQLVVLMTSFLSISDILIMAVASKEVYKIIENNPTIQNRILRAQVDYLTHQEERKLQNSKLNNIKNNSAYSLFETYFDAIPTSFSSKIPKIYSGQTLISMLSAIFLYHKFNKNQKKIIKKQQPPKPKQITLQNTQNSLKTTPENEDLNWYISNDRQYQLLSKWRQLAEQKQKQEFQKKLQKYRQLTQEERKKFVLQKFKKKKQKQQYIEINSPDQSLVRSQDSLWNRFTSKFF